MIKPILPFVFLLATTLLGACSLGSSVASDTNSNNPAVAQQALKIQELQAQVKAQKAVSDMEKQKLNGLEQQLKGAEQNLKGVKTQAKAQ